MKPQATMFMVTIFILMFSISALTPGIAVSAEGMISLDITADTDIRMVLSTIAKDNGINLVIADSVQGKIRISLKEVTPMEAMELILIANGFVMERIGSSVIAGKQEEIKKYLPRSSRVIALQYALATELLQTLSGVVTDEVDIQADTRTNSMIVTGSEDGVQNLEQVIKLLDVELPAEPEAPMVTRTLPLKYTQASSLQKIISGLSSPGGTVGIDDSTNTIVITGEPSNVDRLSEIVAQLDVETPYLAEERVKREEAAIPPPPPPELRTQVFNLNHIDANAIKDILQAMLSSAGRIQTFVRQTESLTPMETSLTGSFGGDAGRTTSTSTTSSISAERQKWSDLLIVTDVDEVLEDIGKLIEELDTMAPQVKIEAKIVEINLTAAIELGINWQAAHSPSDSTIEADFPVSVLDSLTLNLGTFTKERFEDITVRLQALESRGIADIMFNPSVITLDNEMAQMLVADRIPITRTFETEFRATTGFEYINVGISLTVVPHITEDGYVIVDAMPQVDSIKGWTAGENSQPIISSRVAHARVRVKDGETFAIGGLIKDEQTETRAGIPILSRIPLLGRLFGSKSTTNIKTDLIIFITPTIQKDNL